MGKIRGTHSSPGVFTQISSLSYAAKTLGITSLGLVGETKKGPAFEAIEINKWDEYYTRFGGTDPELYKDSQYPRYELPYIAKSYLGASDKLYVCRVLGLSGYNAGPAFVITAEDDNDKKYVVAVLRSRGKYRKYANIGDECNPVSVYDTLIYDCDEIELEPYTNLSVQINCSATTVSGDVTDYSIDALNYGKFTIVCKKSGETVGSYAVSLNPGAKDYIYNVLGATPTDGEKAVFVEELYDVMLEELILSGKVNKISDEVVTINPIEINAVATPVLGFVTIPASNLKRRNLGQTFVYAEEYCGDEGDFVYHLLSGNTVSSSTEDMEEGAIYRVSSYVDEGGIKRYVYVPVLTDEGEDAKISEIVDDKADAVYNLAYDAFVVLDENGKTSFVNDMCDYREEFRCASTPWIVSELKGDANNAEVKKLFRFHTISDGNTANEEVKISIANVRPEDGTFDVLVRDYNDSDGNPTILESYRRLSMVPGTPNYIGLKIGTLDGKYELKSNYVMVEVIENEMTKECVPCGFLGYPVRDYSADGLVSPHFEYNLYYEEDIKDKRQYFGLSDLKGVDIDILRYKGKCAYTEQYNVGYTNGFHLDSTLSPTVLKDINLKVTVDGDPSTSAVTWDAVSPNNVVTGGDKAPIIGSEQEMEGTIYENVNLRKFTVYPYGGFDGWDIYRRARTNTDEFKANKYKGTIINGHGKTFSKIYNGDALSLTGNCITSDYYAFLAGINQFENPERNVINLFATPGIDYLNQALLSEDAFSVIEGRGDSVYVVTTPDKPWGARDENLSDAFTSAEAASNLEDTNVNSYYGTTFYPWVKYFDKEHNIYINLPATKDALRDMADVDNKKYPWTASAGLERGNVECTKLHVSCKLEDRDNVYDNRINPLMSFPEGVRIWGNKTLYICDETNPLNKLNTVRLVLYMRRIIVKASLGLIFDDNDPSTAEDFDGIVRDILLQIKSDRGITDFRLDISQTKEQMDAHEMSGKLWVKPTPVLEAIELEFVVTPQGVEFEELY